MILICILIHVIKISQNFSICETSDSGANFLMFMDFKTTPLPSPYCESLSGSKVPDCLQRLVSYLDGGLQVWIMMISTDNKSWAKLKK